jgi:hypothetical protein
LERRVHAEAQRRGGRGGRIGKNLATEFAEREIKEREKEKATCANFAQVQIEGNREVSRDK